jgi:hypothetical protein
VFHLKKFELTIPQEYLDYIKKEIKKPKRLNTELLELWLERELDIENPSSYGNLTTDESHVTVKVLGNQKYEVDMSDACFNMIVSHVQPEPHSHKMHIEDLFHCWLDMKMNMIHFKQHIDVKEKA